MKRCLQPSFVLMCTLLALGELALRLLMPRDFTNSVNYGFDQTSGFEERADGTVHLMASQSRMFHPQTFMRKRPGGVFRIFIIGDSVDYYDDMQAGSALVLTNTYAYLLGVDLRQQGVNAESYNLAVAGYGATRIQFVLRQALNYQPSLIVLKCSDGNADWEQENYERAQEFKSWHAKNWLKRSYLVRALTVLKEDYFLRRLPGSIKNENSAGPASRPALSLSPDVRREERLCRTIRESVALARAQNVPVMLVTQVYHEPDAGGQIRLDDHGLDAFADQLRGPGVSVFSMKEIFSKQPPETLDSLFLDAMHLRRAGHKMMAQALADRILADQTLR